MASPVLVSEPMSIATTPSSLSTPLSSPSLKIHPLKEFLGLRSPLSTAPIPESNPLSDLTDLMAQIIANGLIYAAAKCEEASAAGQVQKACHELFETAYPERFLLHDYVLRFVRHCRFSTHSYSLAMIYLDRLAARGYQITRFNIHKLFAVSVVIASKYLDDRCHTNSWCAKVTGVNTETFNLLEGYFLTMFDFGIFCSWDELQIYAAQLGHILCTNLQLLHRKPEQDEPIKQAS